jgi:membrane protease YdiL (CAAX protease family)
VAVTIAPSPASQPRSDLTPREPSAISFWLTIAFVIFVGFLLPTLLWKIVEGDASTAQAADREPEWARLIGAYVEAVLATVILLLALRWQKKELIDLGLRLVARARVRAMTIVTLIMAAAWIICGRIVGMFTWSLELTGTLGNWTSYAWDIWPLVQPGRYRDVLPALDLGMAIDLVLTLMLWLVVYPIVEEIAFRAIVYGWVRARNGAILALLLSSTSFALLEHIVYPSWGHTALTFIFGGVLALCFSRYGSLLPCLAVRVVHNGFLSLHDF